MIAEFIYRRAYVRMQVQESQCREERSMQEQMFY